MAPPDVGGIFALLVRWGYLIVFVAGVAEAVPFLGWLVPGQAVIIVAAAAAAAGYLDIRLVVLVVIPAGIIGDALSFYAGRHYGRSFLERYGPKLKIGPRHLERSDALFHKYGSFALVIARFSFLTRAAGPILAGMSKMKRSTFWLVNVLGAIVWAIAYGALGYVFGVGFLAVQKEIGRILAATLVAVIGLYLFYRLLRRYASQFTRDDLYLALLGIAGGTTFGLIADRVSDEGAVNAIDRYAPQFHDLFAHTIPFFRATELATSFPVLGILSLVAVAFFVGRRRWWDATLVSLGVGGIIAIVYVLRPTFRAILPPGLGDSFPSATAAIPFVLAGVATYLVAWRAASRRAVVWTIAGGAVVSAVALYSRLVRAAEYPSAVAAGLALGAAWLSVTLLVVEFRLKR